MRLLFLSFLFVQSMAVSATNPYLERGLALAKSELLVGEVDEGSWAAFLKYAHENPIPSTETQPAFEKLRAQNKNASYFRDQITALFEAWRRAKAIAEATHVDEDFRDEHGLYDVSVASSPARSGTGGGAGGGGRGSVVSGTHRSTAFSRGFSVGASTMGVATDQVTSLLEQLRKLKEAADLTNPISAANRASEMNKAVADIREANLQAFLAQDTLRASYIKVLLESVAHRGEVLAAINAPANAGFRTALIQSLLGNTAIRKAVLDALHTSHSGEMIAKLHGDGTRPEVINHLSTNHPGDMVEKVVESHRPAVIAALIPTHIDDVINTLIPTHMAAFIALLGTNESFRTAILDGLLTGHLDQVVTALLASHRDLLLTRLGMGTVAERTAHLVADTVNRATIAQAFVDNVDFRNVLISRLEAGHHAINATRMLWHPIDAGGGAFWGSSSTATPQRVATQPAIDDAKETIRRAYQTMGSGMVANPRKALRTAILGPQAGGGVRNQIGIKYSHLKEGGGHDAPFYTADGALHDPGDERPAD